MKKLMYYLCMMTWIVIVPMSCNEDGDNDSNGKPPAPELLLAKIVRNGINAVDLMYDTESKLTRMNYYSNTGVLSSYTLYEYSEQGIKESRRYKADHNLDYRTVFTLDNFGRVIKGENYSSVNDFEGVFSINSFSYDPTGQLTTGQFGLPGEPVYSREEYIYGAVDHPNSIQTTFYPKQPNEFIGLQVDYTMSDRPIPSHWNDYIFLLGVSGLDELIWEMFNDSSQSKLWNSNEELTSDIRTEATEHQLNEHGYLTRQVLTRESLLNPGPQVEREMTYEYTQ